MWRNNRYHGAGILVAKDKFYYSGLFSNGEKGVSKPKVDCRLFI